MMVPPMLRKGTALAAALTLLLASAPSVNGSTNKKATVSSSREAMRNAKARAEFVHAMESEARAKKMRIERRQEEHTRRGQLVGKLLSKARLAVPSLMQSSEPEFMHVSTAKVLPAAGRRRMEDGGGNDDKYGDDYYAAAQGDDAIWEEFGFDVTQYSLKYVGCAAVATFSDELAAEQEQAGVYGTVLETMRFVIFRLCPTEYCSQNSKFGCSSNYGEYTMLMDDWLQIMAQYNEERFEQYCEFCENCMAQDNRRLADDDGNAYGDDNYNAAANSNCAYYDACYNYADTCEDQNDDKAVDYEDYFECVEFDVQQNNNGYGNAYLGPHCGSDGYTIKIGVYADETCSEYIGSSVNIVDYTGMNFEDDALADYYDRECITCKESDLPYQEVDEDANDANQVNELCEELYQQSAKCNIYYSDAEEESYTSYVQEDNEQMVCSFIKTLVENTYDEGGEVILNEESWIDHWKNPSTYTHYVEEVSPLQIAGLVLSTVGCVLLSFYACYLHRAISRKAPWRPRRGGAANAAGRLSRQNSGIVMGRSRSGGSYHGGHMA